MLFLYSASGIVPLTKASNSAFTDAQLTTPASIDTAVCRDRVGVSDGAKIAKTTATMVPIDKPTAAITIPINPLPTRLVSAVSKIVPG